MRRRRDECLNYIDHRSVDPLPPLMITRVRAILALQGLSTSLRNITDEGS